MSSALRGFTGIVSVNVLMGHQAREIVFRTVSKWATEKYISHNIHLHSRMSAE